MSADIPLIARRGVDAAWRAVASVLSEVTFRDDPTSAYDPATDTTSTTWGVSIATASGGGALKAFLWDDKDLEQDAGAEGQTAGKMKKAMLRAVDLPAKPSTLAELVEGSTVWKVIEADAPPGNGIYILTIQDG